MTDHRRSDRSAFRHRTIRLAVAGLCALALVFAADGLLDEHDAFGLSGVFLAAFGFFGTLAIIGVSKAIGAVLKRPGTYYSRRS